MVQCLGAWTADDGRLFETPGQCYLTLALERVAAALEGKQREHDPERDAWKDMALTLWQEKQEQNTDDDS